MLQTLAHARLILNDQESNHRYPNCRLDFVILQSWAIDVCILRIFVDDAAVW